MKSTPEIEGNVLCDLHAHPTYKVKMDVIVETLNSPGLVGLTVKDIDRSGRDILRYEQAVDILPNGYFKEIDKGRVAKIGGGYFAKTQEIQVGLHHVLALGWEGNEYFPNFETIEEAQQAIHKKNGLIILNHPYSLVDGQGIRLPKSEEEQELIRNGYHHVDEVETHNGHNIDLIPSFLAMKKSNKLAEELREHEFPHFKGTAASDCHRRWEQVKITGIYINQRIIENDGMDGIKKAIVDGNFVRLGESSAGPYVSRISFVRGIVGDILAHYFSKK